MYADTGTLGAVDTSACAVGAIRTGGTYRRVGPDVLELTPDQAPGVTYTLMDLPGRKTGSTIADILAARGDAGRIALSGDLLSDDTILLAGGWGTMGVNERWDETPIGIFTDRWRGGNVAWDNLFSSNRLGPIQICMGAHPLRDARPDTSEPAWTGPQVATVEVVGAGRPENVRLNAADGIEYALAAGSELVEAQELATTAPQGPPLVVTGTWDPAGGLVEVTDWYIQELGPGVRKYGVGQEGDETGDLLPQRPDLPSTDWPGGPDPETGVPRFGPPANGNGAAPTRAAGPGLWLGLAFLGAAVFAALNREGR